MTTSTDGMSEFRTAAATAAHQLRADERAIDDPAKLARAARIVRLALARQRLTLDELTLPSTPDGPGPVSKKVDPAGKVLEQFIADAQVTLGKLRKAAA